MNKYDEITKLSLFSKGGTVSTTQVAAVEKALDHLVFCPSSCWDDMRSDVMTWGGELVTLGAAVPYDYGRGKGKFSRTDISPVSCNFSKKMSKILLKYCRRLPQF